VAFRVTLYYYQDYHYSNAMVLVTPVLHCRRKTPSWLRAWPIHGSAEVLHTCAEAIECNISRYYFLTHLQNDGPRYVSWIKYYSIACSGFYAVIDTSDAGPVPAGCYLLRNKPLQDWMLFKIWSDSTLTTRHIQADCEAGSCGFGPEFCGIGANQRPIWL
jgi:hypothetical protein